MDKAARAKKAGDRLSRKKKSTPEGVKGTLAGAALGTLATKAGAPLAIRAGLAGLGAMAGNDLGNSISDYRKKKKAKKAKDDYKEQLHLKLEGKKKFKSAAHRKAVHAAKASGKR